MSTRADVVVVGGGLAGGALAASLAGAGRSVVLLEREAGAHDKVCGEFLSREAVLYFDSIGLDLMRLGAHRIDAVRLAVGERIATIDLPFPALGLSRRVLDDALLTHAAASGAEIRRGARVQALEFENGAWLARLQDDERVTGEAAFLATGKHDLRGWSRPAGIQPDLVGFKLHWRLLPAQAQAVAGHVELMLFPGGYAGLELIEGGKANLCLLVRRGRFMAAGQQWEALLESIRALCPLLDRRLAGAEACRERPLAVSAIPYGYLCRESNGVWRLGDQAAVIPSFAGDGMSIALHSAHLAGSCYLAGGSAADYQRRLAGDIAGPMRLATLVSLALVRPSWQTVLGRVATAMPQLMAAIAGGTRVPPAALRRAGLTPV